MRSVYIFILAFIFIGCSKENRWDCFKSYGDEKTETRVMQEFESIFIDQRVDMEYRYSEEFFVEVVFGENIIEHIKTEVNNGMLQITNEATCNWVRDLSKRPLVKVYAPNFTYMENRSSGDITFIDTLFSDVFTYEQWESNGLVSLLVGNELSQIYMHVGYADVTVKGFTQQAELYSAATGRLNARFLNSAVALTNNTSIQDIFINAQDYLYAEINERGSILYSGDPELIETNISGSGTLQPL